MWKSHTHCVILTHRCDHTVHVMITLLLRCSLHTNICVCSTLSSVYEPIARASADLAYFQRVVSPGCCKPWLPNIGHVRCVSSATLGVGNSCPCLGKCVREVLPRKVRGFKMDFSRTLLAMATVMSATDAHIDCYPSVGDP